MHVLNVLERDRKGEEREKRDDDVKG